MSTRVRLRRVALIVALIIAMVVPVGAPASARSAKPRVTTIAEGLTAPLGMAVGRRSIYVVQAFTGVITRVGLDGSTRTVFQQEGVNLNGGIDLDRRGIMFTQNVGTGETSPPNVASLARLRHGDAKLLAGLSRYEQRRNPDRRNRYGFRRLPADCDVSAVPDLPQPQPYKGKVDSNPYAVTAHHGGYLIADAAGNSILRVRTHHRRARIRTVAVLPPIPQTVTAEVAGQFDLPACTVGATYWSEPVPTDVEVGPDGRYYVSSLPGWPELPGYGSVFRIDPYSGRVRELATGFSGAVDLAVGRHGDVYVAELTGGKISVIRHGRTRTFVEVASPATVEVGRHGTLYATTNVFGEQGPTSDAAVVAVRARRHHR